MPNWCANRLSVTGLAENVSKVRALMAGAVRPSYAWAKAQGVQLFLADCAGVLRPVTDETYSPYPALTAAGKGEHTPENVAFTAWLTQLRDGAELTEETSDRLHDLWLATGLSSRTWDTLDGDAQAVMTALWKRKYYDWASMNGGSLSVFWNRVCGNAGAGETAALLLPTRLDVEINGFNGGLLDGCVFATLSERFGVAIEHWYAGSGCNFCGYDTYSNGELTDSMSSALEWGEEDEDGYACVTGPDWIINNVGHYGG